MRLLRLALLFALAVTTALTLGGFLARWTQPFEIFSHFRLYFAFVSAALVLVLLLAKQRRAALIALATLVANGAAIGYALALSEAPASANAPTTRIIWANLLRRQAALEAVAALARAERADIVAVTELPPERMAAVRAAFADFACVIGDESTTSPSAVVIVSRTPCQGGAAPTTYRPHAAQYADIGALRLAALHSRPPWNDERTAQRDAVIRAGARIAIAHPGGILVGDFNAAPWSPVILDLHRAGLQRVQCGGPLTRTWRSDQFPYYALPIDHVLTMPALRVTACRVGPTIGSDHHPLIFDIAAAPAMQP